MVKYFKRVLSNLKLQNIPPAKTVIFYMSDKINGDFKEISTEEFNLWYDNSPFVCKMFSEYEISKKCITTMFKISY